MATNQNESIRKNNSRDENRENMNAGQDASRQPDKMDAGNPQTPEVYNTGSNGMGINPNNSDMLWHNSTSSVEEHTQSQPNNEYAPDREAVKKSVRNRSTHEEGAFDDDQDNMME